MHRKISSIDYLKRLPNWFNVTEGAQILELDKNSFKVYLYRWKNSGLVESAGKNSGYYINTLKAKNNLEIRFEILKALYPEIIVIDDHLLQAKKEFEVIILNRRKKVNIDGFTAVLVAERELKKINALSITSSISLLRNSGIKILSVDSYMAFQNRNTCAAKENIDIGPQKISDKKSIKPLSKKLGLKFPYDWSNPEMIDMSFVYQVMLRGIFRDIQKVLIHFGHDLFDQVIKDYSKDFPESTLMTYRNTKKGYLNAKNRIST